MSYVKLKVCSNKEQIRCIIQCGEVMIQKFISLLTILSCLSILGESQNKHDKDILDNLFGMKKNIGAEAKAPVYLNAPLRNVKVGTNILYSQPVVTKTNAKADTPGSSGYAALKNGLLSLHASEYSDSELTQMQNDISDPIGELLFAQENSVWRSHIIEIRKRMIALDYIKDWLLLSVQGARKVPYEEALNLDFNNLYLNFNQLFLEQSVVLFDSPETAKADIHALITLFPEVAKNLEVKGSRVSDTLMEYSFTKEEVVAELTAVAAKMLPSLLAKIESYFSFIPSLSISVSSGLNENHLRSTDAQGKPVEYTRSYKPKAVLAESKNLLRTEINGSHLSALEINELLFKEKIAPCGLFTNIGQAQIQCLESASQLSFVQDLELDIRTKWLTNQLEKEGASVKAVMPIMNDGQWFSCVVAKNKDMVHITVVDTNNESRISDAAVAKIIVALEAHTKTAPIRYIDELNKPDEKAKPENEEKNEKVNFDAPLAHRSLESLPKLEQFFEGKIPNPILLRIAQLEKRDPIETGTEIKNALLLYGPPGTGKSTIAQLMTRLADKAAQRETIIFYVDGAFARTAFQGSAKAKIDDLFERAEKCNKPCTIIIDEIDGASSKVEAHTSTQEDNRSIKAIIGALDRCANNPNIYVIATTNYPENIDLAVSRRFNKYEVANPTYKGRHDLIEYYLAKNHILIADNNPSAVTPEFVDSLAAATDSFSGDSIKDMINEAVQYAKHNFEPEENIGMLFRFKGVDLKYKSAFDNLVHVLEIPFIPLVHYLNAYPVTQLDKHIYAQYKKQYVIKTDIEKKEREAHDPAAKMSKKTWKEKGKDLAVFTLQQVMSGILMSFSGDAYKKVTENLTRSRYPRPITV